MDGPRHNRLFVHASVIRTLPKNMKSLRRPFAAFVAVCLMSTAAFAADASGTRKCTQQGRGGSGTPRETTLTLKQTEGKLTGTVSSPGRDGATNTTEISNGTIKGDVVAFSVEREFGGNKFVMKYSGKLAGDTITGEAESPGRDGGQPTKREWVAKRAK
jgi:hypothetical protein